MPEITVTSRNQRIETLKKPLTGIRLHKKDEGFPEAISEELIANALNPIESSRRTCDLSVAQGKQLPAV